MTDTPIHAAVTADTDRAWCAAQVAAMFADLRVRVGIEGGAS